MAKRDGERHVTVASGNAAMTWEQIGAALDPPCSRQAAQQLFQTGMAKLRWLALGYHVGSTHYAPDTDVLDLLREIDRLRSERIAGTVGEGRSAHFESEDYSFISEYEHSQESRAA